MILPIFCGILQPVKKSPRLNFKELYLNFDTTITELDCGRKCAPYNEHGVPFCCDTNHIVPTSYNEEWNFLVSNTDLWHRWESDETEIDSHLRTDTPEGQVLIECLGHEKCQRDYRAITCRAFPFAPYITSSGTFIGLTYYWQYEELCWVISHLDQVTQEYRDEFVTTYDEIFKVYPEEFVEYKYHSYQMRQVFNHRYRAIPVLHRNGYTYKISSQTERKRQVETQSLSKYGPYKVAAAMPFPDEIPGSNDL